MNKKVITSLLLTGFLIYVPISNSSAQDPAPAAPAPAGGGAPAGGQKPAQGGQQPAGGQKPAQGGQQPGGAGAKPAAPAAPVQ